MLCVRVFFASSMHNKARRKKFSKKIVDAVYQKSRGRCHHCKAQLQHKFDVDHFPVRYADIEDQCCFGVANELDERNLVASCATCNRSHKYEKAVWCGKYSQCPCKKHWLVVPLRLITLIFILVSTIYMVSE
jgi:hypothetical protein